MLKKQNETGEALGDVKFSLKGVFSDTSEEKKEQREIKEITTNEYGNYKINNLLQGNSYQLKEISAPSDYQLIASTIEFVYGKDDKIALSDPDGKLDKKKEYIDEYNDIHIINSLKLTDK